MNQAAGKITEIILWFFTGCLIVLVVTHPKGFASAVTAVGGQVRGAGALLTGQATAASVGKVANPAAAY